MAVEDGRQVEDSPRDRGDRDAVDLGDLVGRKAGLMSANALAPAHPSGSGHVAP